jgi:hypothetical protein
MLFMGGFLNYYIWDLAGMEYSFGETALQSLPDNIS